jgi:hypothetical protein
MLQCARAAADSSEGVQLSIPDCADASGSEIAKLVALELASRENLRLQKSENGLQASLRCDGDSAVISVRDPLRTEPLVLEMQLAQTRREARPRLLALAIAELIATSRLEHVPVQVTTTATSAQPLLSVWLAAGVLRAYQPELWVGALAAGAAHSFGVFALGAELGFDATSHATSAVNLSAHALSAALTPSLVLLRDPVEWSVGLGARLGYVWLKGSPRSTDFKSGSVSGVFVSPLVMTALQSRISKRWAVRLSLELGYVVVPVRGFDTERSSLLELDGLRAAALVGVEASF